MDRASQQEKAAAVATPDPFTPAQLRALKIAIVVMSIILVLGFGAIIARLYYLATQPASSAPAVASRISGAPLAPEISLALPAGAQVRTMSLTAGGDRLAVHFEAPTGPGIVILDLPSGKVASRVRLLPSP